MSASSPLSPPSTARTSTCRGAAEMRPRCGRDAAEMHRAPAGSRPRRRSSHGAVGLPASAPPPPAALSAAARARQAQTRPAAAAPAPDPRAECPLCVWSCAVCVSLHAWPASSVLRPPIPRSPSLAVCLSPLALSPRDSPRTPAIATGGASVAGSVTDIASPAPLAQRRTTAEPAVKTPASGSEHGSMQRVQSLSTQRV